MAAAFKDPIAVIRAARVTKDGKACVDMARTLLQHLDDKPPSVDLLAEARAWLKLGLDHDKAKDSRLLHELKERLDKKDRRAAAKARMRGDAPQPLKAIPGGAS